MRQRRKFSAPIRWLLLSLLFLIVIFSPGTSWDPWAPKLVYIGVFAGLIWRTWQKSKLD